MIRVLAVDPIRGPRVSECCSLLADRCLVVACRPTMVAWQLAVFRPQVVVALLGDTVYGASLIDQLAGVCHQFDLPLVLIGVGNARLFRLQAAQCDVVVAEQVRFAQFAHLVAAQEGCRWPATVSLALDSRQQAAVSLLSAGISDRVIARELSLTTAQVAELFEAIARTLKVRSRIAIPLMVLPPPRPHP